MSYYCDGYANSKACGFVVMNEKGNVISSSEFKAKRYSAINLKLMACIQACNILPQGSEVCVPNILEFDRIIEDTHNGWGRPLSHYDKELRLLLIKKDINLKQVMYSENKASIYLKENIDGR
jgi:hypothetical protein